MYVQGQIFLLENNDGHFSSRSKHISDYISSFRGSNSFTFRIRQSKEMATLSFETSGATRPTTKPHIPTELNLQQRRFKDLKCRSVTSV
jgi:hypothetical protein